jgi:hypothetical protein
MDHDEIMDDWWDEDDYFDEDEGILTGVVARLG